MEFRILGPLEVVDGGEPVPLGTAKQQTLLGVLLLHANEVVSRERLIDELWGERPPATADKAVQVYVSQLRKALAWSGGAIATRAHGYVLEVATEHLDVARFQKLVGDARERLEAGEMEAAARLFRQALALWRGHPLAGLGFESQARAEVEGLEEIRLSALMDLLDCELALGRHEQAIGELERLVGRHPLQERLRGQLMLALYRSGRQADALGEYRKARQTLVDELGIEPSSSLQRLERAILTQDPSLEAPTGVARVEVRPAAAPPTGTVTFLFTDIERSTDLVRRLGDEYPVLLAEHQRLLREAFGARGGHEVDRQGDALFVAFRRARDAVAAAVEAQRAIAAAEWPQDVEVRIRIGIHTGEPGLADTGYHGLDVVRAARIAAAGHGGQILVSGTTRGLLTDEPIPGTTLEELGEHRLKGFERPDTLYQVAGDGLAGDFPPLREVEPTIVVAGREDELAAAAEAAVATGERRRKTIAFAAVAVVGVLALLAAVLATTLRGTGDKSVRLIPNSVGYIDAESGRVTRRMQVGRGPRALLVALGSLWVANHRNETVTRIRLRTGRSSTIPVRGHPVALTELADEIWVATLEGGLVRIDPRYETAREPINIELSPPHGGVAQTLGGIAAAADSLWVSAPQTSVIRVDPNNPSRRRTIVPDNGAVGPILFADGSLWVAGTPAVLWIDPRTEIPGLATDLRSTPRGLAYGAESLWATIRAPRSEAVVRIDPAAGIVEATIPVGVNPGAVAFAAGSAWVANRNDGTVSRIDPVSNRVVDTIEVGATPTALAGDRAGVWVAAE